MTPRERQPVLELGPPPSGRFRKLSMDDIIIKDFGSPPEPELVRSIGISGVLVPVLARETDDGKFVIDDGRRRVLGARDNELRSIPAVVLNGGNPDVYGPAVTLQANDTSCPNPVVELEAIEELMRQVQGIGAPAIAKALGIRLKTVKSRLKLTALRFELRDGWKAGAFGTWVGEKAAGCNQEQQAELLHRFEANGTLTRKDIQDVKRTTVRSHQRTLADERRIPRAIETLERVRAELEEEFGDIHPSIRALDEALDALRTEAAA